MTKHDKELTIEEKENLEIFTVKEAQNYACKKLGIGKNLFWECIRPELNPKPILWNHHEDKPARLAVLKKDVDRVIVRAKEKLLE